ncbi:MAG: rhamnulokinase family protein [Terriglobales bacterium]
MADNNAIKTYLAFDLGAESGRAVLGYLNSGILRIEEVRRFGNDPVEYGGSLHWDMPRLWLEMRKALAGLKETRLDGIGVDTWGVDYALLGKGGELLQNPYHYRDARTKGVMDEVFKIVPKDEIYRSTGIQFMPINTLYQLFAANESTPGILDAAQRLVTIADLLNYWLTGNIVCEFTSATTTQMVDPRTRTWAVELIDRLHLPSRLLAPIVEPGSLVGVLRSELAGSSALIGTRVIAPACHDTGSAIAAISAREGTAFLSSGTWSLLGTEIDAPVITDDALRLNFTNEGGVNGTTRLLKNVMGLWMLRGCRQSWAAEGLEYDYRELMELASREIPFQHLVDPDDESFLSPADMCAAIAAYCNKTHQRVPATPGAHVRTILESLAMKYRSVIRNLEKLVGRPIERIKVVGGGSKNRLLNQFTADATGRPVLAGPAEATALGNIAIQILATGEADSLQEVRALIDRSFPTEVFEPVATDQWEKQATRFQQNSETIYA